MKILTSDFKGHQLYNASVNIESIIIDLEKNIEDTHKCSLMENILEYSDVLRYYTMKNENNLYLLKFKVSKEPFNRIEKHYGMKKIIKDDGFDNVVNGKEIYVTNENDESFMYFGMKVDDQNIANALLCQNAIFWMGHENIYDKIIGNMQQYRTPTEIKNIIISEGCVLIELLDLGIDGNSVSLFSNSETHLSLKNILNTYITKQED